MWASSGDKNVNKITFAKLLHCKKWPTKIQTNRDFELRLFLSIIHDIEIVHFKIQ